MTPACPLQLVRCTSTFQFLLDHFLRCRLSFLQALPLPARGFTIMASFILYFLQIQSLVTETPRHREKQRLRIEDRNPYISPPSIFNPISSISVSPRLCG